MILEYLIGFWGRSSRQHFLVVSVVRWAVVLRLEHGKLIVIIDWVTGKVKMGCVYHDLRKDMKMKMAINA